MRVVIVKVREIEGLQKSELIRGKEPHAVIYGRSITRIEEVVWLYVFRWTQRSKAPVLGFHQPSDDDGFLVFAEGAAKGV